MSTENNDVELKDGLGQEHNKESEESSRTSSQMEPTNIGLDVRAANDIKNNQSGRNNENVVGATESSNNNPVSDGATDNPNVSENKSDRDTENAADTIKKKRDSPNDEATHKPVEMNTPNVPDDQSKKDAENVTCSAEEKRDSTNNDAIYKPGETGMPESHSGKTIKSNEDTSESSTYVKGTTTITESKCHGEGSPTNVPDNTKISPGQMDYTDSKDTAGNFSNPDYGLRFPRTPEGDVKSRISWNDKMKTQAVTVVLVMYGILILLLYMVMNTPVPSSSIPIPRTPKEVLQKISDISLELNALKAENSELRERVNNTEANIQRKESEISKLNETVKELKQMVEYLREKVPSLDGKVKWMEQEQTEHGNYIVLFLVIFLLIFLGVTVLIMRRKDTQPTSISSGRVQSSVQFQSKVGGRTYTSVLDKIHPIGLEKTIGIVSFNNKTQKIHKEMLQRALSTMDIHIEIDAVLVDREDKILTIKPSSVVFIFVDRNDRNIILEDPESEIGNLRRITTQSFMKMGSTVVVVYVNDRESRNLDGRDLYNPFLQSVKRHPVLRELQAEGRVFSVMDNFNQNQNEHIKQLLKKSEL